LDIWTNVFDAMESRDEGMDASMVSKELNEAWYQSKHWDSYYDDDLRSFDMHSENMADLIRVFEKINWNIRRIRFYIQNEISPIKFTELILKHLKKSVEIDIMIFNNSECMDLTTVVENLPLSVRILRLHAEGGWMIDDETVFPSTLDDITMVRREFSESGHQKPLGGSVRSLCIARTSPFYVLKPCCLKIMENLEYLRLAGTNSFAPVDLPLEKFPALTRVSLLNSSCSLLKDGSELHILGMVRKKKHVSCVANDCSWETMLGVFDVEPRGEKDVHFMDEDDDGEYFMEIDGQSVFVNYVGTPINVWIDGSSVTIEDVTNPEETCCLSDSESEYSDD